MYPRLRPQRQQRRLIRELNFGFFLDCAIFACVTIDLLCEFNERYAKRFK